MLDFFSVVRRWAGLIEESEPAENRVPIHSKDTGLTPTQKFSGLNIRMGTVQKVHFTAVEFACVGQTISETGTAIHPN